MKKLLIVSLSILASATLFSCNKNNDDKGNGNCSCDGSYTKIETARGIIFAPNAFTPNGDGVNESYKFSFGSAVELDSFRMVIDFPANGEVFATNSIYTSWGGNITNEQGNRYVVTGKYYVDYYIRTKDGEIFAGCQCVEIPQTNQVDQCLLNNKDKWVFADQMNLSNGLLDFQTAEKFCN